jgi:glycosyltransferase
MGESSNMKISIITVCFNSAATIADTMRSVAEQSHGATEHIVVDGLSGDNTLDVVQKFASPRTRVISEPDRGIYDAMNKGLTLATGDVVGFLNADDMLASPQTIAKIAASASSGADAVYGDLLYVNKDQPDKVVRYWKSGSFSRQRLLYGWMPPHPTLYLRRSLLQSLGQFDLNLRIAADYDFMLRCLTRPDVSIAYLPEVLVHMRTGGASNRSLSALRNKSREDLLALRKNAVGGWPTLLCKNMRKVPQFFQKPQPPK